MDPNNIKVDEKSYKNILIHYIGFVTITDSKYIKKYSVNPLYFIFNNMNVPIEVINRYLTLVLANNNMKIKFNSDNELELYLFMLLELYLHEKKRILSTSFLRLMFV